MTYRKPFSQIHDGLEGIAALRMSRRDALRRAALLALASPLAGGLLAACGGSNNSTPTTAGGGSGAASTSSASGGSGATTTAKQGGTLTVALNLEPDNLDPAVTPFAVSHTVMMNIYDTLVWRGQDGTFVPGLATKWDVSSDGKTYTLTLREGPKFHDGTDFNADAVKFAFDHIVDPASHSGFAANLLGPYDHTEVVDSTTAKVVFTDEFAPFLDGASQAFLGIVSPTAVQKDKTAFLQHPVGTGFMKFDEWVLKDHITLSRNPDYNWGPSIFDHQGAAYLDKIVFRFYTDDPTRLAALESGDVQDIETIAYSEQARIKGDNKYQVLTGFFPGIPSIHMIDTTVAPTDDIAVRQAINFATDRASINQVALFSASEPALGPLWKSTPSYWSGVEDYYPFDLSKAQDALDKAGWTAGSDGIRQKDGKKLTVTWAQTPSADSYAELLQAQLRKAGIDLQINKMATSAAFDAIEKSQVNIAAIGWISSDPVILSNLFLSTNIDGGYAWTKYSDPKLDDALNKGEKSLDESARDTAYQDAQKIIMDNALINPLFGSLRTIGASSKFAGLKLDFRKYQWLYDVHTA